MYIPNLISTFKFNIFPKLMVMMMRGIPGYRKVPCLAVMLESTGQPVISVRNEAGKIYVHRRSSQLAFQEEITTRGE